MTTQLLNWEPVVSSFLKEMKIAGGFDVVEADDGEEQILTSDPDKAAKHVCACDEGWVVLEKDGWKFTTFIVLGNEPCETVSDWSWNKDTPEKIQEEFDSAWSGWSESWENRQCPLQTKYA
jgi:hypothetical protein